MVGSGSSSTGFASLFFCPPSIPLSAGKMVLGKLMVSNNDDLIGDTKKSNILSILCPCIFMPLLSNALEKKYFYIDISSLFRSRTFFEFTENCHSPKNCCVFTVFFHSCRNFLITQATKYYLLFFMFPFNHLVRIHCK